MSIFNNLIASCYCSTEVSADKILGLKPIHIPNYNPAINKTIRRLKNLILRVVIFEILEDYYNINVNAYRLYEVTSNFVKQGIPGIPQFYKTGS